MDVVGGVSDEADETRGYTDRHYPCRHDKSWCGSMRGAGYWPRQDTIGVMKQLERHQIVVHRNSTDGGHECLILEYIAEHIKKTHSEYDMTSHQNMSDSIDSNTCAGEIRYRKPLCICVTCSNQAGW